MRSTWYGEFQTDRRFPCAGLLYSGVSRQLLTCCWLKPLLTLANFVVTQVCKQSSLPECVAARNYDVCFLIECRATEKTWINSNQPFIGLWRIKSEAFIGRLGDCESARNAHFDFHQKLIKPTHGAIEPETDAGCDNDRHFCEHLLGWIDFLLGDRLPSLEINFFVLRRQLSSLRKVQLQLEWVESNGSRENSAFYFVESTKQRRHSSRSSISDDFVPLMWRLWDRKSLSNGSHTIHWPWNRRKLSTVFGFFHRHGFALTRMNHFVEKI